jgi:hypothetical protein
MIPVMLFGRFGLSNLPDALENLPIRAIELPG